MDLPAWAGGTPLARAAQGGTAYAAIIPAFALRATAGRRCRCRCLDCRQVRIDKEYV